MYNTQKYIIYVIFLIALTTCENSNFIDPEAEIEYCLEKARETLETGITEDLMPRTIKSGQTEWTMARVSGWTSGYWTGILWLLHQYTRDSFWMEHAVKNTELLIPDKSTFFNRQGFGLSVMLSVGHAFDQTQNPFYKDIILNSAHLYYDYSSSQPEIFGLNNHISLSENDQQQFNHSLLNLSLLFKASENETSDMYEYAQQKAIDISEIYGKRIQQKKNNSQPRPETQTFSNFSRFNTRAGNHNRYNGNESLSDRNIAWLMYGFITSYNECNEEYLWENAHYLARLYIQNNRDGKTYKTQAFKNQPMGSIENLATSAIAASALLKISLAQPTDSYTPDFFLSASDILSELASHRYKSYKKNKAFLIYENANSMPSADVSLIYTDYYYLEALIQLHEHNTIHYNR